MAIARPREHELEAVSRSGGGLFRRDIQAVLRARRKTLRIALVYPTRCATLVDTREPLEQGDDERQLRLGPLLQAIEQVDRLEPTAGENIQLTIDTWLQARVQALFDPALGLAIVQPWHRTKQPEPQDPLKPRPRELPLATPLNGSVVDFPPLAR